MHQIDNNFNSYQKKISKNIEIILFSFTKISEIYTGTGSYINLLCFKIN